MLQQRYSCVCAWVPPRVLRVCCARLAHYRLDAVCPPNHAWLLRVHGTTTTLSLSRRTPGGASNSV